MAKFATVAKTEARPLRLNLGAGGSPVEGYDNSWDRRHGKSAYPLDLPDNSADEIRASHITDIKPEK